MFERFTDRAKQVVSEAQNAALDLGHDFIGTEHLLLGLATVEGPARDMLLEHGVDRERARAETLRLLTEAGVPTTGGQTARDALAAIGIDVAEIQRRADESFGPGAFRFPRPPFTPRAKKALELTLRESKALGHHHIGTEHLLLGVLAEGEGVAVQVLTELDAETAVLRRETLKRMTALR